MWPSFVIAILVQAAAMTLAALILEPVALAALLAGCSRCPAA